MKSINGNMKQKIRKFKIALDEKQLNILVNGLHKLPGDECLPLLGNIREQIATQSNGERRDQH
jgi:hypothetical protein